ncbi:hypothetical protein L202_08453 [Cryptococcus amylolentus CBS 6039]|uniref:Uncharacterized protein n=1 Tax=Cryptococcus amylolentus CBS 6039 TaxID=1295533 RepID=A0A1E3H9P1_9TREE|nr:hypothetical protein L202_08453 [Cryptococcus amylolentus CBS 6039]ODN73058.1 hypothetical protein L202_08453 [Cryptococcus amylolentus CBS 6039]
MSLSSKEGSPTGDLSTPSSLQDPQETSSSVASAANILRSLQGLQQVMDGHHARGLDRLPAGDDPYGDDHVEDELDFNFSSPEDVPRTEEYRQQFTDADHQRSTASRGHSVTFIFSPADTGRINRWYEEDQRVTLFQSTSPTNPDGEEEGDEEEQVMAGDAIRGQLSPMRERTPLIWSKIENALSNEVPEVLDEDMTIDFRSAPTPNGASTEIQ